MTGDPGRAARAARTAAAPGRRPSRPPATSASRRERSPPRERDDARRRRGSRPASCRAAELPRRPARGRGDRRDRRPRGVARARSRTAPLTVALLPDYGGGIEYPSFDLRGHARARRCSCTRSPTCGSTGWSATPSSAIPWLDEAFASWAEGVVDQAPEPGAAGAASTLPGAVGGSMADYPTTSSYFTAGLRQGRGRAAGRAGRRRPGGVRRGDPLLRRRASLAHRHAADLGARARRPAGRRRRPRPGRGPGPGRRARAERSSRRSRAAAAYG